MGRRIPAIGRPARHIDDAAAHAALAPVQHRAAAKVGRGLQVDLHRAAPGGLPLGGRRLDRDRLEHPGVVHEHVDPPPQGRQRPIPEPVRRPGLRQVRPEHRVRVGAPMPDHPHAPRRQRIGYGRSDAARGAGDEDVGRVGHGRPSSDLTPRRPVAALQPSPSG